MGQRILYIQYTNPAGYPPLEHSSRLLVDIGWKVLFLGTGAAGAAALTFPPHEHIAVRRLAHCHAGWRQKAHYLLFVLWVIHWMLRWRPQWIYASDLLSTPAALLLSYWPGLKVLYHEHDSPTELRASRFNRFCLWCRQHLATRARMCVLPNRERAEWFRKDTNCQQPVLTVWNCPSIEEVKQPRPPAARHLLIAYYHGNVSPDLLPATLFEALAMLDGRVELRVVGYETNGYQGYLNQLKKLAQDLKIRQYVTFLPARPRHELLQVARACDVGLALVPVNSPNLNLRFLAGASNKPFDYMASGLALLISDLPDWRQMYVQPGYGLTCNRMSAESIAAAFRWLLENPVEARQMGERGRQRIAAEWNYETQFRPVLAQLSQTT